MKIRLSLPKWLQRKRAIDRKRDEAMLEALERGYEPYKPKESKADKIFDIIEGVGLSQIIGGFVVIVIGISLVGPMTDAISQAANSTDKVIEELNQSNSTQISPGDSAAVALNPLFEIMSNKFFMFAMLVGIPLFMFFNIFRPLLHGGMY